LALMCACFGLRIGEALALKWDDVDGLNGPLRVERGILQQVVDDVKTDDSRKTFTIADDLLKVLKSWKQATQFSASEKWNFRFPSPAWETAVLLHWSKGRVATGSHRREPGISPFTHVPTYVSGLAGFSGNARGSATASDASFRPPHDDEYLWGRCDA
jgi:integrase